MWWMLICWLLWHRFWCQDTWAGTLNKGPILLCLDCHRKNIVFQTNAQSLILIRRKNFQRLFQIYYKFFGIFWPIMLNVCVLCVCVLCWVSWHQFWCQDTWAGTLNESPILLYRDCHRKNIVFSNQGSKFDPDTKKNFYAISNWLQLFWYILANYAECLCAECCNAECRGIDSDAKTLEQVHWTMTQSFSVMIVIVKILFFKPRLSKFDSDTEKKLSTTISNWLQHFWYFFVQ